MQTEVADARMVLVGDRGWLGAGLAPRRNVARGAEDSCGCRTRPKGEGGAPQRVPGPACGWEENE